MPTRPTHILIPDTPVVSLVLGPVALPPPARHILLLDIPNPRKAAAFIAWNVRRGATEKALRSQEILWWECEMETAKQTGQAHLPTAHNGPVFEKPETAAIDHPPHPALHVTAAREPAAGLTMRDVARGRGVNTSHERRGSAWARAPPAGPQGRIVPARQGRPGPALLLQRSGSTSSLPFPRYTVTARKKKNPPKKTSPTPCLGLGIFFLC